MVGRRFVVELLKFAAVAALEELRFGLVDRIVADTHFVVEEEQIAVDRRLGQCSG